MNVVIPNDVADAIETFRKDGHDNAYIMYHVSHVVNNNALGSDRNFVLASKVPFDTLMSALINGYDREMTAEQRAYEDIRMEYVICECEYARGILFTLDTLGVKVAGVNG